MMNEKKLTLVPRNSISTQIYEYIKERILDGEIEPGKRLIERDLCELFEASRTPIREACRLLEQDGLVERLPQGGIRATQITSQNLKDVFGIRAVLEPYAAELACDKITSEEIAELNWIVDRAETSLFSRQGDPQSQLRELWELNNNFHDIIFRATRNMPLIKILDNLMQLALPLRVLSLIDQGFRTRVWQDHRLIISHLENKEKGALKDLVRRHVEQAGERALKGLRRGD